MKDEKKVTGGISFIRLMDFLSLEFKTELAKDYEKVKKTFMLESENAYRTCWAVIKSDVEENTPKKKKGWFK